VDRDLYFSYKSEVPIEYNSTFKVEFKGLEGRVVGWVGATILCILNSLSLKERFQKSWPLGN